jgi:membrane protein implicated in regulation of membrane protease activity
MTIWMWAVVIVILIVAELLTVDLLFASLAISATAALIANALGYEMPVQGIAFALFATLSLLFLRPIALKHLKKEVPGYATNMDALIGAPALALTEVDLNGGQIKLNGEVWSARSAAGTISTNTQLSVVSIEGATALVVAKDS